MHKQTNEITVSGNTYEEALENGLQILGLGADMVDVEQVDHSDEDLLPNALPLEGVTLKLRPRMVDIVDNAKEHLETILKLMGIKAQVEVLNRPRGTVLNILGGDDDALIIGKQGQNLDALQYLVNRMATKGGGHGEAQPVMVDTEGYYEKHYKKLEDLAVRAAKRILRDERVMEVAFPPMPAGDRRMIHMILREMHGIHTISRGEGNMRHIVVTGDRMEVIGSPLGNTRYIKIKMNFDSAQGGGSGGDYGRGDRRGRRRFRGSSRRNNYNSAREDMLPETTQAQDNASDDDDLFEAPQADVTHAQNGNNDQTSDQQ